jgi:hypothetical protein
VATPRGTALAKSACTRGTRAGSSRGFCGAEQLRSTFVHIMRAGGVAALPACEGRRDCKVVQTLGWGARGKSLATYRWRGPAQGDYVDGRTSHSTTARASYTNSRDANPHASAAGSGAPHQPRLVRKASPATRDPAPARSSESAPLPAPTTAVLRGRKLTPRKR